MSKQRKKNIRLLVVLLGLSLLTVATYFLGGRETKSDVDKNLFHLEDLSTIDAFELKYADGQSMTLTYDIGSWKINDSVEADRTKIDILFAILDQVQVRRPVSKAQQEEIEKQLAESGVQVKVYSGEQLDMAFVAGGNVGKTLAYFKPLSEDPTIPYVVNIPGYRNYVSGLFEMNQEEWRDKLVFGTTNWSTLEQVTVRYPDIDSAGFEIVYDERNYTIAGMPKPDTTKLFDFLDNVSYLKVNRYIDIENTPTYDSLSRGTHMASIKVQDLGKEGVELLFFPYHAGGQFALGSINDKDWALFDARQVRALLLHRQDFREEKE